MRLPSTFVATRPDAARSRAATARKLPARGGGLGSRAIGYRPYQIAHNRDRAKSTGLGMTSPHLDLGCATDIPFTHLSSVGNTTVLPGGSRFMLCAESEISTDSNDLAFGQ